LYILFEKKKRKIILLLFRNNFSNNVSRWLSIIDGSWLAKVRCLWKCKKRKTNIYFFFIVRCGTYFYKALMNKTCCPLYTIRWVEKFMSGEKKQVVYNYFLVVMQIISKFLVLKDVLFKIWIYLLMKILNPVIKSIQVFQIIRRVILMNGLKLNHQHEQFN
jgi:hypothetical protein